MCPRVARIELERNLELRDGQLVFTPEVVDPTQGAMGCGVMAIPELEIALDLNPSYAWAHYGIGAALVFTGRAREAFPHLEYAIRLSPRDPYMGSFLVRMADAHLFLRQYEAAIQWARKALRQPNFQWSRHGALISALAHLGRLDESHRALDELLQLRPNFSLAFVRKYHLISDPDDMGRFLDGLRMAGVPSGE